MDILARMTMYIQQLVSFYLLKQQANQTKTLTHMNTFYRHDLPCSCGLSLVHLSNVFHLVFAIQTRIIQLD